MNWTKSHTDTISLVVFMSVALLSFVMGLGWLRVIFGIGFLLFKIIILVYGIWYLVNIKFTNTKTSRVLYYLTLTTYLAFNLFFVDGGDDGVPYCFFRLITFGRTNGDDIGSFVASIIALTSLILSIAFMIASIITIKKAKKKQLSR